ncbi:MAG: flagellar hook-basal body complex protein, partial [Lysinibacillus sp.]
MLRSMYSGISGLKNFQTKLDVIGNNISNVNTHGFKKGRVVFKDLISQTTSSASGSSPSTGGVNAKQVGLGSQLAAIDTVMGTGSLQQTGRTLDLAIEGEGFFVVAESLTNDPGDPTANPPTPADVQGYNNTLYTRAGNFYMDADGYLVNAEGKYLVGLSDRTGETATDSQFDDQKGNIDTLENGTQYDLGGTMDAMAPIRIPTTAQSMAIGQDGTISYVDASGNLQYAGTILVAKFPNAEGLEKQGGNYYQVTQNSGDRYVNKATLDGIGKIVSGTLEMSNVDLSEEFTEMIVAQ